jgi:hypothetical protein
MNGLLRPLVLLVAIIGAGTAMAQKRPPRADAAPPADATPADSVRRAERQAGGEVIRAEPMQRDGREVYRLKVLTADGRVRVVQDDPQARSARPQRKDPQVRRPEPTRSDDPRDEESDPF